MPLLRSRLRTQWPNVKYAGQCVYSIRVSGSVAIHYPKTWSPVLYIGEGSAYDRIYQHAGWLVPLVSNLPLLDLDIRVAEVTRKKKYDLYKFVEADMIRRFANQSGSLPWFNKQYETSHEGKYTYESEAEKKLKKMIGVVGGNTFTFAIQPTANNEQFEPFSKV